MQICDFDFFERFCCTAAFCAWSNGISIFLLAQPAQLAQPVGPGQPSPARLLLVVLLLALLVLLLLLLLLLLPAQPRPKGCRSIQEP